MANYFVKNVAGDLGSDGNTGLSDSQAWLTLAKLSASAFLNPDDTVFLKCGSIFAEQLAIRTVGNVGGTSGHQVTFSSYGTGTRPIISAADMPTFTFDQAVAGGHRYTIAVLGWTTNFLFREDGPTIGDGVVTNLTLDAGLPTALHHWWKNGTILYVVVRTGEVPQENGVNIHVGRRNFCVNEFADGQDFITLQNLIMRFNNDGASFGQVHLGGNSILNNGWVYDNLLIEWGGLAGVKMDGLGTNSFADTRLLTVKNCVMRYNRCHGAQFIFISAGSIIENSRFYGNGNSGLGLAARNTIVRNCAFNENANQLGKWTNPNGVQGFDHGLYLVGQVSNFDRASGNTISDCSAYNNAKAGFATDALCSKSMFLRCSAYSNTLYGWQLEGGTTNSSSSNSLVNCSAWSNKKSGLHVINCHGPFDARNCQFYGNGKDGSQDLYIEWNIGSWDYHSGTTNTDGVYRHGHNECDPVALGDQRHSTYAKQVSLANCQSTASSWFFDGTSSEGTVYVRKFDGSQMTLGWMNYPFVLDYNNYTPVNERPVGHAIYRFTANASQNSNGQTLATLQADLVGKEAHGKQHNPVYVDTGNADFRLAAGSPSIDTGVVVTNVNDGGSGSSVYKGTLPDVGAFEFDEATGGGVWVSNSAALRIVLLANNWVKPSSIRRGTDR